jgi:ABC-type glycerol-3-phosphate transport system permease component
VVLTVSLFLLPRNAATGERSEPGREHANRDPGADPDVTLYNHLGLYDTVLGIILFHVAFGLPFAIFQDLRQFGADIALIAPASFISLIVPPAVFFAFQRYFVKGLLAGSVK